MDFVKETGIPSRYENIQSKKDIVLNSGESTVVEIEDSLVYSIIIRCPIDTKIKIDLYNITDEPTPVSTLEFTPKALDSMRLYDKIKYTPYLIDMEEDFALLAIEYEPPLIVKKMVMTITAQSPGEVSYIINYTRKVPIEEMIKKFFR